MKSFEFNNLYILQSLSPTDIVRGLDNPNKRLIETIDSVKKQNSKLSFFNYELITIKEGKSQFEDVIAHIVDQCSRNDVYPMIHFLGHGKQDQGVYIWNKKKSNYDCIKWEELFYQLATVNIACHNNLFFTTTACHGFDSFKALLMDKLPVIPIVGIIAIDPTEKFYVVDAEIIFCEFYKTLLETHSINDAFSAVDAIKSKLIGKVPYIAFSDDWFIRAYKNVVDSLYSENHVVKLLEHVAKTLDLSDEAKNEMLSKFLANADSYKQSDYIAIRDKKFMLKDPKVKKDRFDLPDSIL